MLEGTRGSGSFLEQSCHVTLDATSRHLLQEGEVNFYLVSAHGVCGSLVLQSCPRRRPPFTAYQQTPSLAGHSLGMPA